jgi:7-cyano-7-deazaguanine synthase
VTLELPMRDIYPATHWAVTGHPPAYDTPDEDVYLIGRNLTLLSKAGAYFLAAMGHALTLGLDSRITVAAPFLTMHKEDVIRRGLALSVPFELTLSCMNPTALGHCGACSKCRERHDAFRAAGLEDPAM